ncbi:MAG: hypothetical protein M1814_002647 [Vezdaea aestivalis]|nr:MAG: hypothetical protein M1814_002647 [Vezdaea aestivalis]
MNIENALSEKLRHLREKKANQRPGNDGKELTIIDKSIQRRTQRPGTYFPVINRKGMGKYSKPTKPLLVSQDGKFDSRKSASKHVKNNIELMHQFGGFRNAVDYLMGRDPGSPFDSPSRNRKASLIGPTGLEHHQSRQAHERSQPRPLQPEQNKAQRHPIVDILAPASPYPETSEEPDKSNHLFTFDNGSEDSSEPSTSQAPKAASMKRVPMETAGSRDPVSIPYTTAASQFLYGTSVVTAALKAKRRQLYKLYIYHSETRGRTEQDETMNQLGRRANVTIQWVTMSSGLRMMDKMAHGRPHNGYVLEASPLPIPFISELPLQSRINTQIHISHIIQNAENKALARLGSTIPNLGGSVGRHPLVLLLSNVLDPGNLGSIVRSAYCLGATAIVLPERDCAPLSEVALKASAGAAEFFPLLRVKDQQEFVRQSKHLNWRILAAERPDPGEDSKDGAIRKNRVRLAENVRSFLKHQPCLLIIGGEGDGFAPGLRRLAEVLVGVSGFSERLEVDSLNVSVAAGLLIRGLIYPEKGTLDVPELEKERGKGYGSLVGVEEEEGKPKTTYVRSDAPKMLFMPYKNPIEKGLRVVART